MTHNVIKRDSKSFIFESLIDCNVAKAGDYIAVKKDSAGYHGINNRTGKRFRVLLKHMRNGDFLKLHMQWNYI